MHYLKYFFVVLPATAMCLSECIKIRAKTNIKFYNSNIFQINERINELFFKNFLKK